jgi:glycerol-3-phosphate dehydrogenase (NAD(P)+)
MRIAVLGAGAWGTALAVRWAQRHDVTLVARRAEHRNALQRDRQNTQYLPRVDLPEQLQIAPVVAAAPDLLVLGVTTSGVIDTVRAIASFTQVPLVALCKGFVSGSAALPSQVIAAQWAAPYAVLSGPSFAQEVARGLPAAVMLACADAAFANATADALRDDELRIYPSTDVVGVEIGGAVKNVLAIAAGLCDGLRLGYNARAALITRGLAEMTRLAVAIGGRAETLSGLAGMGDLVLTCTGDLSRNRRVGLGLAQGRSLEQIVTELGHVAEGVPAAHNTVRMAKRFGIDMPICAAVADLLNGVTTPPQAVKALMTRSVPSA